METAACWNGVWEGWAYHRGREEMESGGRGMGKGQGEIREGEGMEKFCKYWWIVTHNTDRQQTCRFLHDQTMMDTSLYMVCVGGSLLDYTCPIPTKVTIVCLSEWVPVIFDRRLCVLLSISLAIIVRSIVRVNRHTSGVWEYFKDNIFIDRAFYIDVHHQCSEVPTTVQLRW